MSIERMGVAERMSAIVIHNETVYLAGQIPADMSVGIQEQTKSVLAKIDVLLEQAGTDRNYMLAANIYIRDMRDFQAMNEVWNEWIPADNKPTRACVEARMSNSNMLVEVVVTAAVKK